MIDTKELRRLALDGDLFAVQALIDRLEAAERQRDSLRLAHDEWSKRTAWVHRDKTLPVKYLGWHVADILKSEIDQLRAEAESWKGLAKQFGTEADALRAKIAEMENQHPVALVTNFGQIEVSFLAEAPTVGKLYTLPGALHRVAFGLDSAEEVGGYMRGAVKVSVVAETLGLHPEFDKYGQEHTEASITLEIKNLVNRVNKLETALESLYASSELSSQLRIIEEAMRVDTDVREEFKK